MNFQKCKRFSMSFYFLIYNIHTKTLFLIEYLLYLHKRGCFVNIILKGEKNKIFKSIDL